MSAVSDDSPPAVLAQPPQYLTAGSSSSPPPPALTPTTTPDTCAYLAASSPSRRASTAYGPGVVPPPVLDLDASTPAGALTMPPPLPSPALVEWSGPSRSLVQPAQDALGPARRDSFTPGVLRGNSFSFAQRPPLGAGHSRVSSAQDAWPGHSGGMSPVAKIMR